MRILILTTAENNLATRAIISAGRKRGHKMLSDDPSSMNLLISNIPSGYDRLYLNKNGSMTRVNIKDLDAIIPRIGQQINYSSFIVDHLSQNLGIYSTQSAEGILNAANKLRTLQFYSDCRIPTPRTVSVNGNSPLIPLIEKLGGFPVIVKLVHGSGGAGVALLNDRVSAVGSVASVKK